MKNKTSIYSMLTTYEQKKDKIIVSCGCNLGLHTNDVILNLIDFNFLKFVKGFSKFALSTLKVGNAWSPTFAFKVFVFLFFWKY